MSCRSPATSACSKAASWACSSSTASPPRRLLRRRSSTIRLRSGFPPCGEPSASSGCAARANRSRRASRARSAHKCAANAGRSGSLPRSPSRSMLPPTLRHKPSRVVAMRLLAALAAVTLAACGATAVGTIPRTVRLADFSAAAVNPVTVSPLPRTPDASPSTQISFLGAAGTRVSSVRVVGSLSGSHSGKLAAYSTGTGESFIPAKPFTSGEHVKVSARVSQGTSTATVTTSFDVAFQAPVAQAQFPINPGSSAAVQHYLSAPAITPSTVRITTPARGGATPGDLFLAPYQGMGTPGPMIVDQTGNLIWFHALPAGEAPTNFQP